MKILQINKFFYLKGGAEHVFLDTARLLENKGNKIVFFSMKDEKNDRSEYEQYFVPNVNYEDRRVKNNIIAAANVLYNFKARKNIEECIEKEKPDIAHLHNIYHQLSPSILHSLKKFKVPIVMTLHDYKPVCASYSLLSNGKVCEACRSDRYYNCLLRKCVKNSYAKSLLNTLEMYLHHKILRIYDLVDIFIAPSQFLKNKIEQMGFKGEIVYLSNFVTAEDFNPHYEQKENSIVYFGRLSKEKGLITLFDAMKNIKGVTLKVIGTGPIEERLLQKIKKDNIKNISLFGYKKGDDLKEEICKARFIILPSECYENNPRSILEGFCMGKPAVAARIGGIPELVIDGETGMTFEPGNSADLQEKINWLLNNPLDIIKMGRYARKFVEEEFNQDRHCQGLIDIYKRAMSKNKGK